MTYEILYTSAPSGLRPGSSGYCTVSSSRGIPAPTVEQLESLSGYRHLFPLGHEQAPLNPVNFGHYLIRISGRREHVLSRVSDYQLDYTGRSNKLAHHIVLGDAALLPCGPAALLQSPGWMYDAWDGQVGFINSNRAPVNIACPPSPCTSWERVAGDAGWAGVVAESFLADPAQKVFVVFPLGTDLLALFKEALSLLPESKRWDVTFATFGAALPATVECLWNGIVAGSPEVGQSRRFIQALWIDLTQTLGKATGGPLVVAARTGKLPLTTCPPVPTAVRPPWLSKTQPSDIADDDIEFKEYSSTVSSQAPPLPSDGGTGSRRKSAPPKLPSSRSYQTDSQIDGRTLQYAAGAAFGGMLFMLTIALILLWPFGQPAPVPTPGESSTNVAVNDPQPPQSVNSEQTLKTQQSDADATHGNGIDRTSTAVRGGDTSTARENEKEAEKQPEPAKKEMPNRVVGSDPKPDATISASKPLQDEKKDGHVTSDLDHVASKLNPKAVVLCPASRSMREDGAWITRLNYKATLNKNLKDPRFFVPVGSDNEIPAAFVSATVKFPTSAPWDCQFTSDRSADKINGLKLAIPTGESLTPSVDPFIDRKNDSSIILNGPKLETIIAFAFSGVVFTGDRPYLVVFQRQPIRLKSMSGDRSGEDVEFALSKQTAMVRGKDDSSDSMTAYASEIARFASENPHMLQLEGLQGVLPSGTKIQWNTAKEESGDFKVSVRAIEEFDDISLRASLVRNVNAKGKRDHEIKLKIKTEPSQKTLEEPFKDKIEKLHAEWVTVTQATLLSDFGFAKRTTDTALGDLIKTIEMTEKSQDSPQLKESCHKAIQLVNSKRDALRQIGLVENFFKKELPQIQLTSGRICYTLTDFPDKRDKYVVDVVVIGESATDVDYYGWDSATAKHK